MQVLIYFAPFDPLKAKAERKWLWGVFAVMWIATSALSMSTFAILREDRGRNNWAPIGSKVLGICNCVLNFVTNVPQIYSTFRAMSVGSVSMVTVWLQMVGAGLMATFQILNDATQWVVWSGSLVSCSLNLVLGLELGFFYLQERKRGIVVEEVQSESSVNPTRNETKPLLSNGGNVM